MNFVSPTFLFAFLPIVLAAHFLLPGLRLRNVLLLASSLLFYAWGEGLYLGLLLLSIALNYGCGLWVDRCREHPMGGWVAALAVTANLAILGSVKYAGFFVGNLNDLTGLVGLPRVVLPPQHLPIGLSFFTLHAISYVLDVWRRKVPAERNPLHLGLYMALFPQLILGPIVRYRSIAPQFVRRSVTLDGFGEGVRRFVIGLGKKVLIADTLAGPADAVFALPLHDVTAGLAWLGVVCFTFQMYFDFSGYADMAVGLGKMFGFRFRENFDYPFAARSKTEFFQRWHISFFTWMRDYLYGPLRRKGESPRREDFNLLVVFFCTGLWHGANWTFILWGLLNGVQIVVERHWLLRWMRRWWPPLRVAYVLSTVLVGMTFFRAGTLSQTAAMLSAMIGWAPGDGALHYAGRYFSADVALALAAAAIGSFPVLPWLSRWWQRQVAGQPGRLAPLLDGGFAVAAALALGAVFLAAVLAIASGTYQPFIYFRI